MIRSLLLVLALTSMLLSSSLAAGTRPPDANGLPAPTVQPRVSGGAGLTTCKSRVLDAKGKPVADARVALYGLNTTDAESSSAPKARLLGEKRTGSDGTFAFTVAKERQGSGVAYIFIQKEGLALSWIEWWMSEDQEYDIKVGEPKELSGIVVDQNGRPVADALVGIDEAFIDRGEDVTESLCWEAARFLDVRTDVDGRFTFPNMPAEATFDFRVMKPGRATVRTCDTSGSDWETRHFSPGQTGIKIVLPTEARIQGTVVEKVSGKPVAGMRVVAKLEEVLQPGSIEPVACAGDGSFSIGGLAPGHYTVRLAPPAKGMAEWVAEPVYLMNLVAGEIVDRIKLELVKGSIIEIVVKDDKSGEPIDGVEVTIEDSRRGEWPSDMSTDQAGLARFRVLPGTYSICSLSKEGYAFDMGGQISMEDGETQRVEYTLTAETRVIGVVQDVAGKPAARVELVIMAGDMEDANAVTDPNGRFDMTWDPTWLDPNTPTALLAAKDSKHNWAAAIDIDAETRAVELKLQPAVTLTGKVMSREGKPLVNAQMAALRYWYHFGEGPVWEAATAADGSFEIGVLPVRPQYEIHARAEGYGTLDTLIDARDIKNNRLDVGLLKLAPANLSISGIVVDPEGKPVAGAYIVVAGDGQGEIDNVRTDENGKFMVKGLCAGFVHVHAFSWEWQQRMRGRINTEAGATDVKIAISREPLGELSFVPRKPQSLVGKPLPELKNAGIELPSDAEGKMLLVCLWDMSQRPCRYCVTQLAARAGQLGGKGVMIVAIQVAKAEEGAVSQWAQENKIPFKVGSVTGDFEKMQFEWGAPSLPHLILTDKKHVVVAEGFGLGELEKKIEEASSR